MHGIQFEALFFGSRNSQHGCPPLVTGGSQHTLTGLKLFRFLGHVALSIYGSGESIGLCASVASQPDMGQPS